MKSFLVNIDIRAVAGTHKIYVRDVQSEKPIIIFRTKASENLNT